MQLNQPQGAVARYTPTRVHDCRSSEVGRTKSKIMAISRNGRKGNQPHMNRMEEDLGGAKAAGMVTDGHSQERKKRYKGSHTDTIQLPNVKPQQLNVALTQLPCQSEG